MASSPKTKGGNSIPQKTATKVSRRINTGYILPDGPKTPFLVRLLLTSFDRSKSLSFDERRTQYGTDFTIKLPIFGKCLVVSEPDEIRPLFKADPAELGNPDPNLGSLLGSGSLFALSDEPHRAHRKLLTPAFHGNRLAEYRDLMAEEARAGMADWPAGESVASLPAMRAITLNIILRTVFGAEGHILNRLRDLLPRMAGLGSILAALPIPQWQLFGYAPWGRFNRMRAEYNEIIDELITRARADPAIEQRSDILAMLIGATYDDGTPMSDSEIADELLTLLAAGHETIAAALAWAIDRLRRHPAFLDKLVAAVDAGDEELLDATINEVQRTRPAIAMPARRVLADHYAVGPWRVPRGMHIMIAIPLVHTDPRLFDDPNQFRPERFLGKRPDPYELVPFGGGLRRCIGAAFAHLELKVVLRTLLTEHVLVPTSERGEATHSRGVAVAPADGGQIVRHPRQTMQDVS